MTTESHAQQAFDLIAENKFYLLTDNILPYVNHDYPFEALNILKERMENMLDLTLDNAGAFPTEPDLDTHQRRVPRSPQAQAASRKRPHSQSR